MFWHHKKTKHLAKLESCRIPKIDASKCVHSFSPMASCQACAEICPPSALIMGDDMLAIAEAECIGCGLCQAACPQSAIQIEPQPFVCGDAVLLVCSMAKAQEYKDLSIGCVHQTGLEQLAGLNANGVRRLIARTANCTTCEFAPALLITDAVSSFNKLAESRHIGTPMVIIDAPDEPEACWFDKKEELENTARREMFSSLLNTIGNNFKEHDKTANTTSLANFQRKTFDPILPLFAHVPRIDSQKCCGCDACTNICPQGALTLVNQTGSVAWYKITAADCNGCGLCVDICSANALSITNMGKIEDDKILLREFICSSCGAPCHIPEKQKTENSQCRICSHNEQHKKLFQILS